MSQDTVPPTKVENEEDDLKVFVGNLAFQTTEEQLTETFSKPNPVVKVNIITRGTRSLGYGFVTYGSVEHVKAAVEAHNKSQLGGREINVEVAKRIVERPQAAPKEKAPKKPRESNKESAENGEALAETKPRTGRKSRPNRKNNKKSRNEGEEGTTAEESAPAPPSESKEGEAKDAKDGSRRKRTNPRRTRKPVGKGADGEDIAPRPVGPPSKTTVFVANLPFSMKDSGLKALFADFKVKSAHVVCRQASGRSKGFGFVELEDEAEQLNVLEKMKDAKSEGRDLVIKIALSEEKISEKAEEETSA